MTLMTWGNAELQYLDLLENVLHYGDRREGRNGGTRSLFGRHLKIDLADGFPLLTTKKVHLKSIIVELLWFLRGDTNVKFLHDHGVTIWDEWADDAGELGPVYGKQWRSWSAPDVDEQGRHLDRWIDQVERLITGLREDPYGRRHIVTAWNPAEVDDMALPPCHCLFQFHVTSTGLLNCQLYQRSADVFLGVPFNIASYALLTMMVAKVVGLKPGMFIHTFGDVHLYENHVEAALTQLQRAPRTLPTMTLANHGSIDGWLPGYFTLSGYNPHPAIQAPVSK